MTRSKTKKPRDEVYLQAFDSTGGEVLQTVLSYLAYYEGLNDLIDKSEYRRQRGIVRLEGKIYDLDGNVEQEFENHYDDDGNYVRGRSKYADGTIQED